MKINYFRFKYSIKIILLIIALFYVFTYIIGESREDQIKNNLKEVQKLTSFTDPEHPVEILARAKKISEFLAPKFTVIYNEKEKEITREDANKRMIVLRKQISKLETSFTLNSMKFPSDKKVELELTVSALGHITSEDGDFFDQHRVLITLQNNETKWQLVKAVYLENLRE